MPRTAAVKKPLTLAQVFEHENETKEPTIPDVSAIEDQSAALTAVDLLAEASELRIRTAADTARLKEIKEALCDIAEAYDLPGMRSGSIALSYIGWQTKKTLDKKLLIENGVDPSIIPLCMKESKPFRSSRFIQAGMREQEGE